MRKSAKLLLFLMVLTVSVNIFSKTIDDYGGYEYDFEVDSIYYTVHDDGVYVSALKLSKIPHVIYADSEENNDSAIYVSAMYHGFVYIPEAVSYSDTVYRVTGIEDYAFKGCTELESVSIPSSVKYIGDFAFSGCTGMEAVSIQPGATYLGDNAFSYCSSLKEIVLPYGIESIRDKTFGDCASLTTIDIPESVRSIGFCAFTGCGSLRELNIPEGVKSLGNRMIERCYGLKYLTIPESVEVMDVVSLIAHPELLNNTFPVDDQSGTGLKLNLFEHRNHIRYVQGEITVYKKGVEYLQSLTFDILCLPENGLFNCIIGQDMDSIPDFFQSGEYSLGYKTKSILLERMETLYIPESVKYIGTSAFYGCLNLKEVVIGGSPVISESAFSGCDNLEKIALSSPVPPTVNESSLDRINMQAEAETGERVLFSSDVDYTEKIFVLPEASGGNAWYLWSSAINYITVELEYDIPGWYDIYVTAVPNSMIPDAVDSNPMYLSAIVEYRDSIGTKQSYFKTYPDNPRKQYKFIVDGECIDSLHIGRVYLDNPTKIGFKRIVSVRISSAVTPSNKHLYSGSLGIDCVMMKLVSLTDPATVTDPDKDLEELDFSSVVQDSLTEALYQSIFSRNVFEDALLSVPENAVGDYRNSMLWKRFINMEGYTSGGYDPDFGYDLIYFNLYHEAAFVAAREVNREKFRGIFGFDGPLTPRDPITGGLQPRSALRVLDRNRTAAPTIGPDSDGSSLYRGNLTIPESVMFDNTEYSVSGIDYYAFMGCRELESITIPESVTKLGYGSFAGCIGLKTIVLPSGVRNIPDALFYGCIRLDNVIIPEGVDTIGHSAFYECAGLTEIVIPADVKLIDEYAFYHCVGLKRVIIEGNPEIAPTAFLGCGTGLEIINTGIESIDADHHEVYGPVHYGIDGRLIDADAPGFHLIRMPDGRMKKALILSK